MDVDSFVNLFAYFIDCLDCVAASRWDVIQLHGFSTTIVQIDLASQSVD